MGRARGWLLLARYRPGSVGSAVSGLGLVGLQLGGEAGVLPALAAGWALPGVDAGPDDAADVAAGHPGLAAAARHLVGRPIFGEPPAGTVPIVDLLPRERRRLATMASPDSRRLRWRTWCTFRAAPPVIWQRAAAGHARTVLENVARVTGHAPAGRLEAAEVVADRPIEVTLAGDADLGPDEIDAARSSAVDWLDLLEDSLFERGWLRVDPAVPGALRHPDGTVLDARSLTDRAATDPAAYAELRRLLGASRVART
jgi:hypothetical protein